MTKMTRGSTAAMLCLAVTGCDQVNSLGQKVGVVGKTVAVLKLKSVALKCVLAAEDAVINVALQELGGLGVDAKQVLGQVFAAEPQSGLPPGDRAVFMVVNKKTNDVRFWRLTDQVKMIRLKSKNPVGFELKVLNESPLRVELWLDSTAEVDIMVEMKD